MTWEQFYTAIGLPVPLSALELDSLEAREALAERTPGARTLTLAEHPMRNAIWLRVYRFNTYSGGVCYDTTDPRLRSEVERLLAAGWRASADWKTSELLSALLEPKTGT